MPEQSHTSEALSLQELTQRASSLAGQEVQVYGWVRSVRESKALGFIDCNDGTQFKGVQIVFERDSLTKGREVRLSTGCAIGVKGRVQLTPESKQPFEIHAQQIELVGDCPVDYPLQKKRHSFEFLRSQLHLRARTNTFSAVFRVRSLMAAAIHEFFQQRQFIYLHTPIITGSDAEGAGEMFQVTTLDLNAPARNEEGKVDYSQDFFGKASNLTVSGQLYGEAYALAFSKIYTFGPTFRAEHSFTPRHAAEFWMIEPEIAFADLAQDMQLAQDMVRYILRYLFEKAPDELAFFDQFVDKGLLDRLHVVADNDFERISYTEAIQWLERADQAFEYPVQWGNDLQTEHERYLTEKVFQKPVFVTDYPKDIKAFYMRQNDDGKTVAAMDLLVPGVGEIIGGSQREERMDVLEARLAGLGMDREEYWWYMELRKYGGCPHAGFGLGFERMMMYATGMSNIRDVLPFPRTTGNADF